MLDAILSHLAYNTSSSALSIFNIDVIDIDEQLQKKFARDGDSLDFPDLEEVPALEPDEIFFDLERPVADTSVGIFSGGMLTRGRLRGRSSNIMESSPGSTGLAPKRGLLKFTESSPPDPFQSKSPPRLNRRLFKNRDLGSSDQESSNNGQHDLNDSHIFGAEVSDEMDIDNGSDSSF
jgi:hypothetical protein